MKGRFKPRRFKIEIEVKEILSKLKWEEGEMERHILGDFRPVCSHFEFSEPKITEIKKK
jgi:hypothetical protein